MKIQIPCVVRLTWRMCDAQNVPLAEVADPTEFLLNSDSDLLPALQELLIGQEAGFQTQVQLEPEQAFGHYDAELVCLEPRALFDDDLTVQAQFDGLPAGHISADMPSDAVYTVTEIYDSHVVLDGNHPLAGLALRFDLTVHEVRVASDEELSNGYLSSEAEQIPGLAGLEIEATDGWASMLLDLPSPTRH